jgi:hypothetical protein
MSMGITEQESWKIGKSSKGWWRLSKSTQMHMALNNAWFGELGLLIPTQGIKTSKRLTETAGCDNARPVV